MSLYDYIYVDLDKVVSVYSQMTGGVVEALERSSENATTSDNKRQYDFRVFRHDVGGTDSDKTTSKATIKPHHALLKELEEALIAGGYLLDLNSQGESMSLRDVDFRSQLKNTFCIKVRGRVLVEDFERIKGVGASFPEIMRFVNKSKESTTLSSAAYIQVSEQLVSAESHIASIKDKNLRSKEQQRIKELRGQLANMVRSSQSESVEKWVLDGMNAWIDAFLPGIVNFRVYPFTDRPEEHIFGHLKKQCFEDQNTTSFHFTYGSFPTEEMTMIGIVTSVPLEGGETFSPLGEFEKQDLADYESVENGFRGVFRGFDGLEQMIRTCRFPRILVNPIMVYRSVAPNNSLKARRP